MKIANKMTVACSTVNVASVVVFAEGSLSKQIVYLYKGFSALVAGQTATMETIKNQIDATFTEKGEECPTKGTEYRKICYQALVSESVVDKSVTIDKLLNKAETDEEKAIGKFLKRVSDYIRNNYEPKKAPAVKPHSGAGEGEGQLAAEKTDTEKRIEALANVAMLFAGNDAAQALIDQLKALA